jgi:hypothetical protein
VYTLLYTGDYSVNRAVCTVGEDLVPRAVYR